MNVPDYYDYLRAAREQLWNFLRALPAEDLDRELIQGERFHNIKDLLLHVMDVEDHWVHGVARGAKGYHDQDYAHEWGVPNAQQYDLSWILSYGRSVQAETMRFLASSPDLDAKVALIGSRTRSWRECRSRAWPVTRAKSRSASSMDG